MPTTVGSGALIADGASSILLGRGTTNQYLTTTAIPLASPEGSYINSFTSAHPPSSTSAELLLIGQHDPQQPEEVTAIQTPLLVGLEHSSALIHSLIASFSVILVSELGDKTFIITAIMAMKNSRSLVFMSSAFALFLMTVLSVGMGVAVTVIPALYTHYASIVLFLCFGIKMLKEAYDMVADSNGGESEFEEVKRIIEEEDEEQGPEETDGGPIKSPSNDKSGGEEPRLLQEQEVGSQSNGSGQNREAERTNYWKKLVKTLYLAPIVIKVFTMILVAEWGDRSQISTVILAAREDVVGVFIGSFSGHVLCTGLAVIGGRVVAKIISIRTLTFLGGIIFLFFATFAIIVGPD